MKDVKVLIGNYGSGKSELALNFAMQAAALLRCALRQTPEAEKRLQAQNIMMLLAFAASAGKGRTHRAA